MNRYQAFALLLLATIVVVARGSLTTDSTFFNAPNRAPVMGWHYDHLLEMIGLGSGEQPPAVEVETTAEAEPNLEQSVVEPEEVEETKAEKAKSSKSSGAAGKTKSKTPSPSGTRSRVPDPPVPEPQVDQAALDSASNKKAVDQLITDQGNELCRCYVYYADPRQTGSAPNATVKVDVTLDSSGLVESAVVRENTVNNPRFNLCVEQKLKGEFTLAPRPRGQDVTVRYPLEFAYATCTGGGAHELADR